MISWTVVGHVARFQQASDLAASLNAPLCLDDGTLGADGNHLKAWSLHPAGAHWCGVIEDDALPAPGFLQQAEQALEVAPTPVVSFYLGRSRPKRWQERIAPAVSMADRADAHWITSSHVLHAVAVAIHASLLDEWRRWSRTSVLPIDERLSAWCLSHDHTVSYAWPSLTDHADQPTLIQRPPQPAGNRRAWRTGTRSTWMDKAVPM